MDLTAKIRTGWNEATARVHIGLRTAADASERLDPASTELGDDSNSDVEGPPVCQIQIVE